MKKGESKKTWVGRFIKSRRNSTGTQGMKEGCVMPDYPTETPNTNEFFQAVLGEGRPLKLMPMIRRHASRQYFSILVHICAG